MRHRYDVFVAAAVGFAICLATPAMAAPEAKKKPAPAAHSVKHRHSAVAARSGSSFRYQGGVPEGPLYNGQDYLGDDPDPNVRSYLLRDMGRYGGVD